MPANTALVAEGKNYFEATELPITVRRIRANNRKSSSHEHDLTEVEHAHDFCELALITGGEAIHFLQGDEFPITAGDVFLLQGQQRHFYHKRKNLEMINVMYDPNRLPLPESHLRKVPGYCALFMLEPIFRRQHRFTSRLRLNRMALSHVERLSIEMEQEILTKKEGHEVSLLSKLLDLMVYLSRSYLEIESTNAFALLRVGEVIGSIEGDFERRWTIKDLCKISGLSRSQLIRVFHQATGQTPIDYLLQVRLQKAMQRLRQSDKTISEIAFKVGFNDSNYFTRQFKKRLNMTPMSYRIQYKESQL